VSLSILIDDARELRFITALLWCWQTRWSHRRTSQALSRAETVHASADGVTCSQGLTG